MSFVEELVSKHRSLTAEMDRDSRKAQELMAGVARKKRAVDAIEELIRLEGADLPKPAGIVEFPVAKTAGTPLSETAYEILTARGEAMHYIPLAQEVQLRGIAIGGKNPANTLLAHLSRDSRFFRPGRGTYALREWDPKARSVGVRRKKGA
jgi:hypothetical protein